MRNGGFDNLKRLLKKYSHSHSNNKSATSGASGYIEPSDLHKLINRTCGSMTKIG